VSGATGDAFAGYVLNQSKAKAIATTNGHGALTVRAWSTCARPELILALIDAGTSSDNLAFTITAKLSVR
jgi:hypothetical protein